ncbi:hemerythrin domain-containing protein [Ramlibacter ginsenosidimutans]|uniref:Hemerythrin domain-containing protein n=1 Tax=Ramlibacter ginsenosidimutans TaxID=502333 RepID=A0A934WK18_9BURK|nr:hemerythrin domain-containing protein [Ramlibacter ginsenosidimutans]MBK6005254.1 hemerythrin domain-containing protein [Ramlibacter ginsenosidimutans]
MKITSKELEQVAAAEALRFDLYSGIHKALRAMMADTLLALGRMDPGDEAEVTQVTERVLQLLGFCGSHLSHENAYVHPAIEARAPGGSERIAHEHEEHEEHIAELSRHVAQLQLAPAAGRSAAAQTLYCELALFIAGNFQHMHVEETAHNAVLWARYTDAELAAVHDALVGSMPPDEMMQAARWMVPFMNAPERALMLADLRAKAPPPAFAAVLDLVRPHLSAREWDKLAQALELPAEPAW